MLSLSLSLLFLPRTPPLSPLYITSLSLSFSFPEPHLSLLCSLSTVSLPKTSRFSLYQSHLLQVKKYLYVEEPKTTKKNKERKWIFIYLFLYRMNKPNRFCISFNNFISSSIRVCPTSNFDFHFNTIMCAQFICSM